MRMLFDYLDTEKKGNIGYKEFTKLCDEKRRGLDPFINTSKELKDFHPEGAHTIETPTNDDIMNVFNSKKGLFEKSYVRQQINPVEEEKQKIKECVSIKM